MVEKSPKTEPNSIKLVVRRVFNVPAEQLFDAWLDAKTLGRWLFATPDGQMMQVEVDPRVGGEFLVVEKRGEVLASHYGEFVELDRPRRLAFKFTTDRNEPPALVVVEFHPVAGGCELTLTHTMDPKWADYRERVESGWAKILASLAKVLGSHPVDESIDDIPADRQMVITRLIDAPRELVWEAFVKPEHVMHWWGPNGFTNTIHEMDVRPGGVWRFIMHGPNGVDYPNKVVFHEVVRPSRLAYDHGSDDGPRLFRAVIALDEVGDKTQVTLRAIFDTAEACQEKMKFGAVEGGQQTLAKWAEYVRTMTSN